MQGADLPQTLAEMLHFSDVHLLTGSGTSMAGRCTLSDSEQPVNAGRNTAIPAPPPRTRTNIQGVPTSQSCPATPRAGIAARPGVRVSPRPASPNGAVRARPAAFDAGPPLQALRFASCSRQPQLLAREAGISGEND
jgi:hypothetical protein